MKSIMKFTLLLSFFFLAMLGNAAPSEWVYNRVINGSILDRDVRMYSFFGSVYSGYEFLASTEGPFLGYKEGDGFYMKQQDHKTTEQKVDNNIWIATYYGELLCAETFANTEAIPLCDWYEETTDNGQFISNANDFYLAFMSTGDQSEDGIDRYGWFHVALDDELYMSILDSGIGLYGENVYVGASPEPASGLLILLGIASIALRRRKTA